jgi:hypothetical protein
MNPAPVNTSRKDALALERRLLSRRIDPRRQVLIASLIGIRFAGTFDDMRPEMEL